MTNFIDKFFQEVEPSKVYSIEYDILYKALDEGSDKRLLYDFYDLPLLFKKLDTKLCFRLVNPHTVIWPDGSNSHTWRRFFPPKSSKFFDLFYQHENGCSASNF
jgi:hypothetical protein